MVSRNMETYLKLKEGAEMESDLTSDRSRNAMLDAFTDDFEMVEPPMLPHGGVWKGKEEWTRMQGIMRKHWQQKVDIDKMWDLPDDDLIILYTTMEWTANDTGRVANFPCVELLYFRDALICRVEIFLFDTKLILDTIDQV
ncbi:MAG: nuclear transport factor 2 family protein [Acidimicrobiia bacterium]